MEYNTQRKKLIIPEYGRHVHQLVDHCMTIENEEERNKFAQEIINVMGDLNPHLRDVPDFQHKLWDQLFMMSNFELKVNSPYPILSKAEMTTPPKKMNYPSNESKYRYYGTNVKKMIEVAKSWEDGEKKEGLIYAIANQMKKNYLKWNKDQVGDDVIFDHLEELSKGSIKIEEREALMNVIIPDTTTSTNLGIRNRNNNNSRSTTTYTQRNTNNSYRNQSQKKNSNSNYNKNNKR